MEIDSVNLEKSIASLAAKVVNLNNTRRSHPSFGTTKTEIRDAYQRMIGAVIAYGMATNQIMHVSAPLMNISFTSEETAVAVHKAKLIYNFLGPMPRAK